MVDIEVHRRHKKIVTNVIIEYFKVTDGWTVTDELRWREGPFKETQRRVPIYVARFFTHSTIRTVSKKQVLQPPQVRRNDEVYGFVTGDDIDRFMKKGDLPGMKYSVFLALTPKMIEQLSGRKRYVSSIPYCKNPFQMLKSGRAIPVRRGAKALWHLDGRSICWLDFGSKLQGT